MQKEKLAMEERIQKEKLEQTEKERHNNSRMEELEMQNKVKAKLLDLGTGFDVTKHIRLFPSFQEKEIDKYFLHFEKVAEYIKWPIEHWTSLLQSVVIGKAREIYIQLCLEQSSVYDKVKESIFNAYELIPGPISRNLGTAEKKMTRRMLNLLEQKNNYLTDGALQRK